MALCIPGFGVSTLLSSKLSDPHILLDHISQNLYGLDNGHLAVIDLEIVVLLVENLVYILVWLWLNVYWVWFWFSERFLRMVYESMIGFGWR